MKVVFWFVAFILLVIYGMVSGLMALGLSIQAAGILTVAIPLYALGFYKLYLRYTHRGMKIVRARSIKAIRERRQEEEAKAEAEAIREKAYSATYDSEEEYDPDCEDYYDEDEERDEEGDEIIRQWEREQQLKRIIERRNAMIAACVVAGS